VSVVIVSSGSERKFILYCVSVFDDKSVDFNGMLAFEVSKK
jgi:hypothetical protein